MSRDLDAKNLPGRATVAAVAVQFRLTGTPDGNLLVSLYQLDTFSQEAVNWHIASLLVENKMNAQLL